MMRRKLFLTLAAVLSGCLRNSFPAPAPVEDDPSIRFPVVSEGVVVEVGTQGQPYDVDGDVLRALMIAANDLLPPGAPNPPCHHRLESQRFRVMRQGNIFFVFIDENPAACGRSYPALDSGVKYAISTDGRILRRVREGQEGEAAFGLETPDGGRPKVRAEPGVSPELDGIWNDPTRPWPAQWRDGGSGPPPSAPASAPDGGTPPGR
jgi:hypothetical protein